MGVLLGGVPAAFAALASAATYEFGDLPLTVPDGYVVEQVAAPPLVERPVTCDFDEHGRLYVAESSGSNAPLAEQRANPQHRILRLEDVDGDGVFDRRTVFAEGLMMLQGTLWHEGSLYVAAAPEILKLTDHDGDGVADAREVWHDGGTLTGCGNDLHGPYLAPNGRIEFTKGAFAEQTHDLAQRPGWTSRASHVFRCRPDGSDLEAVVTGGMDNPVDVAFTAAGERLLSATFLVHPAGGQRDGVVHAVGGGVFGKDHSVLDGHVTTGDLLPVLIHLGPAAACGLHVHSGFGCGQGLGGDAFVCSFNLRSVSRHRLTPDAGSFRVESEPFLSGDSADFHPTDVIEDADGSLLVVDTGGWYKLCCPTSQMEKPAVTGAIYRIRRGDVSPPDDPRGGAISWSTLAAPEVAAWLGDERPAVAWRAVAELARRGDAAAVVEAVSAEQASRHARLRGVWCLSRIETDAAKAALRARLGDRDVEVRQAAAHAVGLARDRAAIEALGTQLAQDDPAVARAAAEALGRIGGEDAVAALLVGSRRAEGRMLEHAVCFSLIEAGLSEPLLTALHDPHPGVRRSAMVALDRLLEAEGDGAPLEALCTAVVAAVHADAPALRDAGLQLVASHSLWAADILADVPNLLDELAAAAGEEGDRLLKRLVDLTAAAEVADAIAVTLRRGPTFETARAEAALQVIRAARPAAVPESWVDGLGDRLHTLTQGDAAADTAERLLASHVKTLAVLPLSAEQRQRLREPFVRLAASSEVDGAVNLAALQASGLTDALPSAVVDRLLELVRNADGEVSPLDRSAAIDALTKASLTGDDAMQLADMLSTLSPSDVARVLPIVTRSGGSSLARGVDRLEAYPRPDLLPRSLVVEALAKLAADGGNASTLLSQIDDASASQRQRYLELAASLPAGDAARGHRVFLSQKAACTSCHAMAYAGGRVGPDLTRIGGIRTPADLLEAIVLPNASFVRSYEPVVVLTTKGTVVSGIAVDTASDEMIVQTSATVRENIPLEEIDQIEQGTVSLMPTGYDTLLSPQELADLVAFLARAR